MCVGTFAATNRTSLGAVVATKPAAQCKAATDLDLICREDIGGKIRREYAVACLPTLAGGQANVIMCINELAKRDFPTLSDACLGCYSASVACTLQNCLASCSIDANSAACIMPARRPTAVCRRSSPAAACRAVRPRPRRQRDRRRAGTDGGVDAPADAPADAASDTAVDAATDTGSDV